MLGKKKTIAENILILGLGGVGAYLAKRLVHEGYAVTSIEPDSNLIRYTDNHLDARLIQGSAMSMDCWREANAENIDVLIAVTDNDAVNMLAAMIADRFGILRKIARVRSTDLAAKDSVLSAADLKIDLIIHPEELAAQEIVRLVKRTAGNEIIDIADGQTEQGSAGDDVDPTWWLSCSPAPGADFTPVRFAAEERIADLRQIPKQQIGATAA